MVIQLRPIFVPIGRGGASRWAHPCATRFRASCPYVFAEFVQLPYAVANGNEALTKGIELVRGDVRRLSPEFFLPSAPSSFSIFFRNEVIKDLRKGTTLSH